MRFVTVVCVLAGCGSSEPTFHCKTNDQCTLAAQPGLCVDADGVCALADGSCPSGFRYDKTAGDRANNCVVFSPGTDLSMPDLGGGDMAVADLAVVDLTPAPDLTPVPDFGPPTWKTASSGTTQALIGLGGRGTDVYAVGGAGGIFHSTAGGAFAPETSGTTQTLTRVFAVPAVSNVYAVGLNPVLVSTVAGTWSPQTVPGTTNFYGVWGFDAQNLWAVGYGGGIGTILHTINAGTTWTAQTSGVSKFLVGIWGSGSGDVYIVGANATILHSVDQGLNWQKQSPPPPLDVNMLGLDSVFGTSATDVYAVGEGGIILHNAGAGWTVQTSGFMNELHSVWASGSEAFAVGTNGLVLHTVDKGANWAPEASGTTTLLYAVWGTSAGDIYASGDGGVLLHRN